MRRLLEAGVDPNVRDEGHGATPLHHAAWENRRRHVDLLLEHGADPSIRDRSYDGTPHGWASYAGHEELGSVLASVSPKE